MTTKYKLWYVSSPSGDNANAYLWGSPDECSTTWSLNPHGLEERLADNSSISLAVQEHTYPQDEFTFIHEGTTEECLTIAKGTALIDAGDLDQLIGLEEN